MKSKTGGKTKKSRQNEADARLKNLGKLLARAREEALARVRVLRKEEQDDAVELPADDLDVARSLEDIETDAGLIERYEYQLKAIDAALSRLERGRYGICEKCKEEIPIERLKAVPFAAYCIDCQKKRNERRRPGEGDVDEPSRNVWTPPEELKESVDE
jgi:DnaK suppressor protein